MPDSNITCDPWTKEVSPYSVWHVQGLSARRITEDAIIRVTEQGVIRVIERCRDVSPITDTIRTTEDGGERITEDERVRTIE